MRRRASHRAQTALLTARLPPLADAIDTVKHLQGGERDLVVVSATVFDRESARTLFDGEVSGQRVTVRAAPAAN